MLLKNIEIKARLNNFEKTRQMVQAICPKPESIEQQMDTFFITEQGRLKLRETDERSALIYYDRLDSIDPSPSDISISFVDNPNTIKDVLSKSLGIRGVVKKNRSLYLYGQTRIHLDKVEKLGKFIELEVVLNEGQAIEDGNKIANELMDKLNIKKEDLIDVAYIDLQEK